MDIRLVLFSTACFYFMVPTGGINLLAAAAAAKGVVIEGLAGVAGASSSQSVVIDAKPPPHVIVEHKPVTLVPVATIPSFSIVDKLGKLWDGISGSVGAKIQAVGDFLRGPPKVVFTQKPTSKPPVIVEIVEVPHHRVYPLQVPVAVGDCGNVIKCATY